MVYLLLIYIFSFLQISANDLETRRLVNVALLRQQSSNIRKELKQADFFKHALQIAVPAKKQPLSVLPSDAALLKPAPLNNLGVTCYMNASLQAIALMARTAEHTAGSDNSLIFNGIGSLDNSLSRRFITTDSWLTQGYNAINEAPDKGGAMRSFTEKVKNTYFALPEMKGQSEGVQRDAHEFFDKALDSESFRLSYLNLRNKFTLESLAACPGCKKIHAKQDTITSLQVAINPEKIERLSLLISNALKAEDIKKDCDGCNTKNQKFSYGPQAFVHYPEFLRIQLNRFAYEKQGSKITAPVVIDSTLTIGDQLYDLQSVIVHRGASLNSGHYVACVKSGQQWFNCNDRSITNITSDINKVLNPSGSKDRTPYICVYKLGQNNTPSSSNNKNDVINNNAVSLSNNEDITIKSLNEID